MKRSLVILTMLLLFALASPVVLASATPTASNTPTNHAPGSIVDDFNRPNESPLSDGGAWSSFGLGSLTVVSNQLACNSSATNCQSWRNDVLYGLDQEAWVTLATKPNSWVRLFVRLQQPTTMDGYAVRFQNNSGTDQVFLERVTGGGYTTLATFNQEFSSGDKLLLKAEGSTISAWRYTSGAWAPLGSATDSTYLGVGYVGVSIRYNVARLDDFGAETLREPIPDTSVPLDDFDRPNESPLSDGGAWSSFGLGSLTVVSNQLACNSSATNCQSWRNDVLYGLDQEAWVTLATKPNSWVRLFVRLQQPTTMDGYAVRFQNNSGTDQVFLERVTNGGYTTLATFGQEFMHGDKLKIRAVGSTIQAWRQDNNTGLWVKLGEATDSTYLGVGYVGVSIRYNVARLDDFGAETLREPIPDTSVPLDDFNRPNESPLSDGGAWSSFGLGSLTVVSNQLACNSSATNCQSWRNDVLYAPDQEAWVTLATKPNSWVRLFARLQQPASMSGYAIEFQNNTGTDTVLIERVTNGGYTTLATFSREFMHGDKLRIRAVGSTIQAWRRDNNTGLWAKLGEATDSTYTGTGYVGVSIRYNVARLDDFGGGGASSTFEDDALLNRYTPELRFTSNETYRADSAEIATNLWFPDPYRTVVLKHLGSGDAYAAADPNSELDDLSLDYLSTQAFPFDYLSQPNWFPDDIAQAALDYTQWVAENPGNRRRAYGRIIPDPGGSGEKILQYWMYYYYNPKNELGIGKHEGDWEWVHVRLDAANTPVSVALSQHGSGEKCEWGPSVPLSVSGRPIVYVAYESHANYFWPGFHPAPGPSDVTTDDGPQFREVPSVVNATSPPGWILWNGQWGDSTGAVNSPRSPGVQDPWNDPWTWEADTASCSPPPSLSSFLRTSHSPNAEARADRAGPELPRILSARITSATYGKAVRVRYCFRSMPTDPWRRPSRLHLTLENLRDNLPPLSVGWRVKARCGTIMHPVGPIKPPYLLRYSVESQRGTWSKRAQIKLS